GFHAGVDQSLTKNTFPCQSIYHSCRASFLRDLALFTQVVRHDTETVNEVDYGLFLHMRISLNQTFYINRFFLCHTRSYCPFFNASNPRLTTFSRLSWMLFSLLIASIFSEI